MDNRGLRTRALGAAALSMALALGACGTFDVGIEPNGQETRTTAARHQTGQEDAASPTATTGPDDAATGGGIPEPEQTVEATVAAPAERETAEPLPTGEPVPAETPEQEPTAEPDVVVAQEETEIVETPEEEPSGSDGEAVPSEGGVAGDTDAAPRIARAALVTDAEDPAAKPVKAFRSRLDEVYIVGEIADAPEDTELGVEWILAAAAGEEDYEYNSDGYDDETVEIDGDRPFAFHLEHSDPLPAGSYIAELSLDGVVAERLEFSVYEPAPPVLARPGRDLPGAPPAWGEVTSEPTNVEFIVDGSGSMAELIGETPKIRAAQDALHQLVTALPGRAPNLDVGLRAYGQNYTPDKAESCRDTDLLVPMEGVGKDRLRTRVDGLKAVGEYTPMAYAVEQAARDFPAGERNVAILVSDGKENCADDPVGAIKAAAVAKNLTVHVIGFDIGEAEARDQLRAIAEATGGVYADAQTPEDLVDALTTLAGERLRVVQVRSGAGELVLRTPPGLAPGSYWKYVITDEGGNEVVEEYGGSDSTAATTYQLAAGMYTVGFEPASSGEPLRFRVEIGAGQETLLQLGALRLRAPKSTWKVYLVDQRTGLAAEGYGGSGGNFLNGPLVVPPGTYDFWLEATGSSDAAAVAQDVRVKPGAIVEVSP